MNDQPTADLTMQQRELLTKARDAIRKQPEGYDQSTFGEGSVSCDTPACVGGHIVASSERLQAILAYHLKRVPGRLETLGISATGRVQQIALQGLGLAGRPAVRLKVANRMAARGQQDTDSQWPARALRTDGTRRCRRAGRSPGRTDHQRSDRQLKREAWQQGQPEAETRFTTNTGSINMNHQVSDELTERQRVLLTRARNAISRQPENYDQRTYGAGRISCDTPACVAGHIVCSINEREAELAGFASERESRRSSGIGAAIQEIALEELHLWQQPPLFSPTWPIAWRPAGSSTPAEDDDAKRFVPTAADAVDVLDRILDGRIKEALNTQYPNTLTSAE